MQRASDCADQTESTRCATSARDGLERRRIAQLGGVQASLQLALLASRPLGVDEQAETVLEAECDGVVDANPQE